MKLLLTASLFLAHSASTFAFAPEARTATTSHHRSLTTPTSLRSHAIEAEDEAMYLMMKARVCANSETCSIDEAEEYLNEILHIQSDCVTGTLESEKICHDVSLSTEVIAALRNKITNQVQASNPARPFPFGLNPVFLSLVALYIASGILSLPAANSENTFTAQEWIYAARDGYLPNMVSQYFQHGGLAPILEDSPSSASASASTAATAVVPFTFQEWTWAIRDGYLGDMLSAYSKNGGLEMDLDSATAAAAATTTPLPFEADEWSYAVRDGYLTDMIQHYMRNGGL